MVRRTDLPEGEPFRRGMGPRCLHPFAGAGGALTYEGAAGDFWVHFSLCTVDRLRLLSYMCAHGPARLPALAKALCIPYISVYKALHGMQDCRLVASRPNPIVTPFSRARKGGLFAMDWTATEDGRKGLWRYAWVTGKLNRNLWYEDTWNGRTDTPPWEALAQDARSSLLRPSHLAIAFWLRMTQPIEKFRLARLLGLPVSTVHHALMRWRTLGWVEALPPQRPSRSGYFRQYVRNSGLDRSHPGGRPAARWTFLPPAYPALYRHVHALRWAGQNAGYTPPEDDPFLNDTFGPHCIHMVIE